MLWNCSGYSGGYDVKQMDVVFVLFGDGGTISKQSVEDMRQVGVSIAVIT